MAQNDKFENEFEDYDPDLITLCDEDGEECEFEVIDAADFNDIRYLAVVPYNANPTDKIEEDAYLIIMKVEEEDGEEFFTVVDDDEELTAVGGMFANRLTELFDIDPSEIS